VAGAFRGLAVAAASALLLFAGVAGAAHKSSVVRGTGVLRLSSPLRTAAAGDRASLLIVSTADAAAAAREPGRSLVYFAGTDVNTHWDAGVPYAQAAQNGWLLKDTSGNLLVNHAYPSNYVGDVGSPGYQHAWLQNVSGFLRSHHDDGVLIDDVLADLRPLAGVEPSAYPTQQAWAAAQLSFVRTVGRGLRKEGYYVLVNASGYVPGDARSDTGAATASWWGALAPYVSGLMNEYFAETPDDSNRLRSNGPSWTQNWAGWQHLVQVAQSHGRDFVGVSYGNAGDTAAMTYGKASFLLDWNGRGGAYVFEPTNHADPWNSAWTTNIGLPAARKRQVGVGWLRRYRRGIVLVNPSPSQSQAFALPGRYIASTGQAVRSATLGPTSALILRVAAP
jgi:hypothetical protein